MAGSIGAIVTPGLIANFDYNSDGMLSRTEVLGDTDFGNLVSELEKQRKRLPRHILEPLWRWKRETLGKASRDRPGEGATEGLRKKSTPTESERRLEIPVADPTERERLAEFCADVPQSALCRDL